MSLSELRRGIYWRMCGWGMFAGTTWGALYGTLLVPLVGTVIGAFIGAGMGLVLGILNGLLLGSMTSNQYYGLISFDEYQRIAIFRIALVNSVSVAVMMALLVYWGWLQRIDARSLSLFPVCVVIPSFIAGVSSVFIVFGVTQWYKVNAHGSHSESHPPAE